MDKYTLIIALLFSSFLISGLKADDDSISDEVSERLTGKRDRRSNRRSDIQDQRSTFRSNVSENTGEGQIKEAANDKRSEVYDNRQDIRNNRQDYRDNRQDYRDNYNYNGRGAVAYNRNNNNNYRNDIGYDGNRIAPGNRIGYNPLVNRVYNNPLPPPAVAASVVNDVDPNLKDFRTGLSYGTLKILSTLPNCDQQTLLNYRRLLRTPSIRLQFYRDLYQSKQRNYVERCGEGMVKIGPRERAILLGDPYFRRKVELLMARQPIGAAIRGPVRYPNDIGATSDPVDPVLILNKRY